MIQDVNEALRQLLRQELPLKNNEVDISFDQPKREWSSRLNRPTLNLFLYDVHENLEQRTSTQWRVERREDGKAVQRRPPIKIDLKYMITAWATEPEDEHSLLARSLLVFYREPILAESLLPEEFPNQPTPITLEVSKEDRTNKPVDIWSVLDNDLRPSITLMVTLTADPYRPIITPVVRTRELRVGQSYAPSTKELIEEAAPDVFWTIGGTIHTDKSPAELQVTLLERGENVEVQDEGRFAIGRLQAGDYTLEVKIKGGKSKRHNITVPAPDYDIKL